MVVRWRRGREIAENGFVCGKIDAISDVSRRCGSDPAIETLDAVRPKNLQGYFMRRKRCP